VLKYHQATYDFIQKKPALPQVVETSSGVLMSGKRGRMHPDQEYWFRFYRDEYVARTPIFSQENSDLLNKFEREKGIKLSASVRE
jgi:hypothetical protein